LALRDGLGVAKVPPAKLCALLAEQGAIIL